MWLAPSTVYVVPARAANMRSMGAHDFDERFDGPAPSVRRRYWGERQGVTPASVDASMARRLVASVIDDFSQRAYFQEWFGYSCVDNDDVPGLAGSDRQAYALRRTRRTDAWPLSFGIDEIDEAGFFTRVEFAYDHVSKPTSGRYHSFNDCGYHARTFDRGAGRREFRSEVNEILADYREGYELAASGEVERRPPSGLEPLLEEPLPDLEGINYQADVQAAIRKFKSRQSTPADRRDAVRDLVGILELMRDEAKALLPTEDEKALFNIANNFAIRHLNRRQHDEYDQPVWHDWMFYIYLATVHTLARLIEARKPHD